MHKIQLRFYSKTPTISVIYGRAVVSREIIEVYKILLE